LFSYGCKAPLNPYEDIVVICDVGTFLGHIRYIKGPAPFAYNEKKFEYVLSSVDI
jgi:hypothetical protein